MEWPYPFSAIEYADDKLALEAELRREVKSGHVLFDIPFAAIGRRYDQDDVLFEVHDGTGRVAEVHLTWAGERERSPWPGTSLFDSFVQWADSVKAEYGEPEAASESGGV